MKLKLEDEIKAALNDLAKAILKNIDNTIVEPAWPPRYGQIPADIKCGDSVRQTGLLIKTSEEMSHYHYCLALLTASFKDMDHSALDNELWRFYCTVYCAPERFTHEKEVKSLIAALPARLVKPANDYEVFIILEKHLELKGHVIDLAGARFTEMSEQTLLDWRIDQAASVMHKQFHDMVVGKPVAFVRERAYGPKKALEAARSKVNSALNALRVALLIDHTPRIVGWRIHDMELLFRPDEQYGIRQAGRPESATFGFSMGFRNVQFSIDSTYSNQIAQSATILDVLFTQPNLQSRLYGRLRLALECIGGSVTKERNDDKIVDICTAFETLLVPEREGRKGEAIALRMMLLYAHLKLPTFDPVKLLEIYLKRSRIVHGSDRDICTDYDYKSAQWMATDVLTKALAYVQFHNITRHSAFIDALESNRKLIERSVEFWKETPYYKAISESAAGVIAKRFPSSDSADDPSSSKCV